MSTGADVGLAIHPDGEFLDRVEPLVARVDYLEVAPETTWFEDAHGALRENGFAARFRAMGERHGASFVAHGVGLSLGDRGGDARRAKWLARLAEDQRVFGYRWYTDHAGMTQVAGEALALPLPAPPTEESAARTRARLEAMRAVVPEVGLESTAQPFLLGDPLDDARWLSAVCREDANLLLDLHNVWTMAQNLGFSVDAYLDRIDLTRVIELHVSGGSDSDPRWLGGRTVRLDSHDDAVPEQVFALAARVAPQCPRLRGVTLERMEGTVTSPDDVASLARELDRAREIARTAGTAKPPPVERGVLSEEDPAGYEEALAEALRAPDPVAAWRGPTVDEHGLRVAALLVAKLRFERLMRGSREADAWFERDPRAMSQAFRTYHQERPVEASFPAAEGRAFEEWVRASQ